MLQKYIFLIEENHCFFKTQFLLKLLIFNNLFKTQAFTKYLLIV